MRSGSHGRPAAALPLRVQALVDAMHESLDHDWSMTDGWLVMRAWETPTVYSVVVARIEHVSDFVEVDP